MLMPSIFGENLFNDDWMDFSFPDVDKVLLWQARKERYEKQMSRKLTTAMK